MWTRRSFVSIAACVPWVDYMMLLRVVISKVLVEKRPAWDLYHRLRSFCLLLILEEQMLVFEMVSSLSHYAVSK